MGLRGRESRDPDIAIARQRAENDLADLERTRTERLSGLQRLTLAKHGPVRHVATALVLPSTRSVEEQIGGALDDLDPEVRRKCEIAAEDVVIAHETARGFECERVGHLKIGFDIRSIGPADPQTRYRDPITGIRRIEVKGRRRDQPIRLTTNEWYKATQLPEATERCSCTKSHCSGHQRQIFRLLLGCCSHAWQRRKISSAAEPCAL